jgi:hypothetical protein
VAGAQGFSMRTISVGIVELEAPPVYTALGGKIFES